MDATLASSGSMLSEAARKLEISMRGLTSRLDELGDWFRQHNASDYEKTRNPSWRAIEASKKIEGLSQNPNDLDKLLEEISSARFC